MMMLQKFINSLNEHKPNENEIVDLLENTNDENLLTSSKDMYDYKVINVPECNDIIEDIINCTNVYDKGIGEFSFVKEIEFEDDYMLFASTDKECNLFKNLKSERIYSRDTYSNDYEFKLIANSSDDFLECLILYFKMQTEFIFRKNILNVSFYRQKFTAILGKKNAWFFNELVDEVSS